MVSLQKITRKGKAFFLAYDQGLEHGPRDLSVTNADPDYIFQLAIHGKFTAVITQKGVAQKYYHPYRFKIPLIIKLNGKTSLSQAEPYAGLLCTIEEAVSLGASAVGYTVYVGSKRESEMLEIFSAIVYEAHAHGLPVIGWMYPRGEGVDDTDPAIVTYAARVGLEVGADIVKVKYPGSEQALSWLVHCAGNTKVVISGGSKATEEDVVATTKAVMASGTLGLAIGRNIWQQENPLEMAAKLREVIFK